MAYLTAGGHSSLGFNLFLVVLGVLAALAWLFMQAFWPFAPCGKCDGTGQHRSPSGKAWRSCRRCKGTGRRLRVGRKIWDYFQQSRRDAK